MAFLRVRRSLQMSITYYADDTIYLVVDDLSDFSKGQAFERFHCYKQAHIVIACLHIVYSLFLFIFAFVFVYYIFLYVCSFFSFDATILENKDVHIC